MRKKPSGKHFVLHNLQTENQQRRTSRSGHPNTSTTFNDKNRMQIMQNLKVNNAYADQS